MTKIHAIGDISFGDFSFCPGIGIRSRLAQTNTNPFDSISDILKGGDIIFGNLESVLSDYGLNENDVNSWIMRGAPSRVKYLKDAGFNVVNVANNHTMQHGIHAFNDTLDRLKESGIKAVGVADSSGKCIPIIMDTDSSKVGILGYAFEADKYKNNVIGYAYGPTCKMEAEIRSLKEKVDLVIVSCHWGLEFINRPSPNTIQLGRNLINWGADIVLGHHSHTLQGTESYSNGLIFYSMGNFLFDMMWDERFNKTAIFSIDATNDSLSYNIIPTHISTNYEILQNETPERIEEFSRLCSIVDDIVDDDIERNTLKYYTEYEKLRKKNRLKSYLFFLKNLNRIKRTYVSQILFKSFLRKLSAFKGGKV